MAAAGVIKGLIHLNVYRPVTQKKSDNFDVAFMRKCYFDDVQYNC